ncbi:MAG: Ldh family oxidoreductase [Casimicrobiaceae bacterium]
MALYPDSGRERSVAPQVLRDIVAAVFSSCAMRAADARLLADALVDADLRGIHSHGVLRVPDYVAKLLTGGVDPRGTPRIVSERGAVLVADGGNSMGQVGATFAMGLAIARARDTGVAVVTLRGSNHCGAMDRYARMALAEDMIGIATTNALPTMAPWGGADKLIGINPLAFAAPAGTEKPFVLDMAFGATAHGKMRVYAQKGHALPEGWAFDSDGLPTTDVAKALTGLIRPIGEFKGVGLALMTGILSAVLSGAAYGEVYGNMVDGAVAGADGQFFMALDIRAFEQIDRFKSRIDALVCAVRSSRRAPGVDRLYVPGEMEFDFATERKHNGIPLNDRTLGDIAIVARERGVAVPAEWSTP